MNHALQAPLSPALLGRVAEVVYRRSSLRFNSLRIGRLERRVIERAAELGVSIEHYLDLIGRDEQEINQLLGGITTKQTSFFRLPAQFEALARLVLPTVEEELGTKGQKALTAGGLGSWNLGLRVLCAGCATGEEAWSLAMAMLAGLRYPRAWKIEITAGDVSREALETAARGLYPVEALAPAPPEFRRFYEVRDGIAEMGPSLRRVVRFGGLNLRGLGPGNDSISFQPLDGRAAPLPVASRFQIVFCRNVMIYFDHQAQQRLIDGLYHALAPGGWLFTGDAEMLNIYNHRFESVNTGGACVYRKPIKDGT